MQLVNCIYDLITTVLVTIAVIVSFILWLVYGLIDEPPE